MTSRQRRAWPAPHTERVPVLDALRPFVTGRKNGWLSDAVKGAQASANLDSLIETAKANGLEPYAYLRRVFTLLPQATTVADIEALLPWAKPASA